MLLFCCFSPLSLIFFFFNDTATTEIYTLSLHDALPIYPPVRFLCRRADLRPAPAHPVSRPSPRRVARRRDGRRDRKSTRLNSSHGYISYAVFCLKKKTTKRHRTHAVRARR